MSPMKSDRRWTGTSWKVVLTGLACVFLLVGVVIWLEEQRNTKAQEPIEFVALDRTPLNVRLLERETFVAADFDIDPYDASLLHLRHLPRDGLAGSYSATLLAPPMLIHSFSLRRNVGPGGPATGALRLAALLPDLHLRTPENHPYFEGGQNDRLDVTIGSIQTLGRIPDSWHRQFITCEKTSVPHVESDYPGLIVNAERTDRGYLHLKACEPGDALPDGNPLLFICRRDVYTRELTTCRVEFVIPWTNFSKEIQDGRPRYKGSGTFKDHGIKAIYEFSADHLPQWRRVRDLAACLIEAVVVEIEQIGFPSRDPDLCETIRSALHEGRPVLAPGSAGDQ